MDYLRSPILFWVCCVAAGHVVHCNNSEFENSADLEICTDQNQQGNCTVNVGERCGEKPPDYDVSYENRVRSYRNCPARTTCLRNVCRCEKDFYFARNRTCLPKQDFGQPCEDNEMCSDKTTNLHCSDKKVCDCFKKSRFRTELEFQKDFVFQESDKKCVLKLGEKCNAEEQNCLDNAECAHGVCNCTSGYFEIKNGTCASTSSLTSPCKTASDCHTDSSSDGNDVWLCENNLCTCNKSFATPEVINDQLQCKNMHRQKCGQTSDCMAGTFCHENICKCDSNGYVDSTNGTCERRRNYGAFCDSSRQCLPHFTCKNLAKTCECSIPNIYDPTLKSRVDAAGSDCNGSLDIYVPNADCICQCFYNYQSRDSFVNEGKKCGGSRACLPGLFCINGVCSCPLMDHQVYSYSKRKCLSLVQGPCEMSSDCLDKNAKCEFDDNGILRSCICKEGFVRGNRSCDIAYGERCSHHEQDSKTSRCDRMAGLECSSREICECPMLQVYPNFSDRGGVKKCKGLVGSKCLVQNSPVNNINPCWGQAYCKAFRTLDSEFGICSCYKGITVLQNRTCKAT